MKAFSAILGTALLGLCGLAACNATSGPPVKQILCELPAGTQVALAYPINGATGVSGATTQIVIAVSSPLPNTWAAVLINPNGSLNTGAQVATIPANSIPTPFATPGFGGPAYQVSTVPLGSLPTASFITVSLSNQAGVYCNGFPTVGTFTTQ